MRPWRIASRADIAAIEARPLSAFVPHASVNAALEDLGRRHGARPALTWLASADAADAAAATTTWTHAELLARVRGAARLFTRLAGGRPPRVALLLPSLPQAWVALWGAAAAGRVCPINPMLGPAPVAALLQAAEADILVLAGAGHAGAAAAAQASASAWRAACPQLRHVLSIGPAVGADDFEALLDEACRGAPPLPQREAGDSLALFHTGGTTGTPRLACHTHANQLHAAWGGACMMAMDDNEVTLNAFPLFHVAGPLVYGLSTWLAGGSLVLPPPLGLRDAAFVQRIWHTVERCGVTLLATVPTMITLLLEAEACEQVPARVRVLMTGGAPLPEALALRFEQRFGIPVRNILGMTECAGFVSVEPPLAPRLAGSCGLPLPFTQVRAWHEAEGRPCAVGEAGVLQVRGPQVAVGASGDAGLGAAAGLPGGWLVTGDLGAVDAEGRVFVTGRAKDLIIRGGHNIDPQLIEEALLLHPAVRAAAAVGAPDEYAGELPTAYVVLHPGADAAAPALLDFVRFHTAEPAACPKHVEVLDALPLTAIGKVFKPALRLRAIERVIGERLAAAGLAAQVRATAVDDAGRPCVVFRRAAGSGAPPDPARLQRLMAGFTLVYRLEAA
jgi:fatty-acyl-CoA synthase